MYNDNKENFEFVSIKEASAITGICHSTLRIFADQKKITCYKTPSGQRKFHKPSLLSMCKVVCSNENNEISGSTIDKFNCIYARVSSKHQMEDLSRQIEYLQSNDEYSSYNVITDIASGINFKRKGLQTILEKCLQGIIGNVVIAHRDRLARFAYDLIENIVAKSGGQIILLDSSEHGHSNEQELAEDVLSIIHVFNCRQMGRRRYSKTKQNMS